MKKYTVSFDLAGKTITLVDEIRKASNYSDDDLIALAIYLLAKHFLSESDIEKILIFDRWDYYD